MFYKSKKKCSMLLSKNKKERVIIVEEKTGLKKYLPIIIGVVVAVVIIVLLVSLLGGGKAKAVSQYFSAVNKQKADKAVEAWDYAGAIAWGKLKDTDIEDFGDDDYDDFIENYKKVKNDQAKDKKKSEKETLDDAFETMEDELDSYKIKVGKVVESKKLGKDLVAIRVKLETKSVEKDTEWGAKSESSSIATYVIYKNKIISGRTMSSY